MKVEIVKLSEISKSTKTSVTFSLTCGILGDMKIKGGFRDVKG